MFQKLIVEKANHRQEGFPFSRLFQFSSCTPSVQAVYATGQTGENPDFKAEAAQVVVNIKRQTRRKFNTEEKIRIVLAGLGGRGQHCRDF
jgi:hypothetical protein